MSPRACRLHGARPRGSSPPAKAECSTESCALARAFCGRGGGTPASAFGERSRPPALRAFGARLPTCQRACRLHGARPHGSSPPAKAECSTESCALARAFCGRGGGTRTHNPKRRILSPLRMPVPPRPRLRLSTARHRAQAVSSEENGTIISTSAPFAGVELRRHARSVRKMSERRGLKSA